MSNLYRRAGSSSHGLAAAPGGQCLVSVSRRWPASCGAAAATGAATVRTSSQVAMSASPGRSSSTASCSIPSIPGTSRWRAACASTDNWAASLSASNTPARSSRARGSGPMPSTPWSPSDGCHAGTSIAPRPSALKAGRSLTFTRAPGSRAAATSTGPAAAGLMRYGGPPVIPACTRSSSENFEPVPDHAAAP